MSILANVLKHLRITRKLPAGEHALSTAARALLDRDNNVVFDAEALSQGDASAMAAFRALIGSGTTLTGKTLWVDSVNGTAEGIRGQQTAPFLTLAQAKAAALSGDTIVVRPGTYAENNLLKNGVDWYFEAGAFVDYTPSVFPSAGIFDDSSRGANAAITCKIGGNGRFRCARLVTDLSANGTVFVTNASSNISIVCDSVETKTSASYAYAIGQSAGILYVSCLSVISENDVAVWWSNGEMHVTAQLIYSVSSGGVVCEDGGAPTGACFVKAQRIQGSTAITLNLNADARAWIVAEHIVGAPACLCNSGFGYITAQKIEGTGAGQGVSVSGGTLYVNSAKIQGGQEAVLSIGTAVAFITAQEMVSGDTFAIARIVAGTLSIFNASMVKTGSGDGVIATGGTIRLVGCKVQTGASGNPITNSTEEEFAASVTILQGTTLITAATYCILGTDNGFGSGTVAPMSSWANKTTGPGVTPTIADGLTVDVDVV